MGTDIHSMLQAKKNNEWIDIKSPLEDNRHYLLFAWLGNVRNGFGFAGIPTHTPIKFLSDCRGFPEGFKIANDVHPVESKELLPDWLQEYCKEDGLNMWMGDHSHSWLTGEEILNGADTEMARVGVITLEQYKNWDGKSSPDSWCGEITGGDIQTDLPENINEKTTHVKIHWHETVLESLKYFIDEIKKLVDEHGEIRFVFGFDS